MEDIRVLLDLVVILMSLVTYLCDLIAYCLVVWKYYFVPNQTYIVVTSFCFLLFPGGVTSIVSSVRACSQSTSAESNPKLPTLFKYVRYVCIACLISPVSGYIDSLYFLSKRFKALDKGELLALQRASDVMFATAADAAYLRLFPTILAAVPQFSIHLYLLIQCAVPGNACHDGQFIYKNYKSELYNKKKNNNNNNNWNNNIKAIENN